MAEKSFWKEKKDAEWISNFFFYYKKHLIAFIFILFIFLYGCVSCMNKINYDLEIYYVSDKYIDTEAFGKAEKQFAEVVDDVDGKDGKAVLFNDFAISEDSDYQMITAMNMKIQVEFAEGNGYLYFANDYWADFCSKSEFMEDISKYTGDDSPCYFVDVSDNKMLNELGIKHDGKIYVGVRILSDKHTNDEERIKKHDNAIAVLKYILEMK